MKSLLAWVLGISLVSTAAWAEGPHHGGGSGEHRPEVSHAIQRPTVRRFSPARHVTVRRPVTTHRNSHPVIHKKVTVHRHVTVHAKPTIAHHVAAHVTVAHHTNATHFHHVFRAPHRYRIGAWHAPHGFTYRRFGIGERIPAVLLVADFFLTDYALYGLEAPDDAYVWVRDGDDAVLVDRYTGEVVEVEYDAFY